MILEWVFSLFLIQFLIWSSTTKGPWKIDSSGVALSYKDFGCFFLSIWIKVISILSNLHWGVWETFPVYLYSSNVCMWVWLYTRGAAAAASVLHWCIIIHHGWRSGRFHVWFFHVHKSHRHKNDMLLHFCPFAYFVLSKFILVALCSSFPPYQSQWFAISPPPFYLSFCLYRVFTMLSTSSDRYSHATNLKF